MDTPGLRMDEGHFMDEPDPVAPTVGLNMPLFRISLGFAEYPDKEIDDIATKICGCLTTNAALFTGLPVTVLNLTTAQGNFHTAVSNVKGAGTLATKDKEAKKVILLNLLRQNALFIQGIPGMTAANARLSGYDVIEAGPHAPVAVNVPAIQHITNEASGKLRVKVKAPKGYNFLEYQVTVGTAAPRLVGSFPSTRDNVLEDLVSCQLHVVQCRAVYGGNRFSEWSDPVSHMTT